MGLVSRAICTFAQTGLIFFILIYPYRQRMRYSAFKTTFIVSILVLLYTYPYLQIGFEPQEMGRMRIVYSCISIFIQGIAISYLVKLRLPVMMFFVYVIRNLTDSLMMSTRFIHLFLLSSYEISDIFIPFLYLFLFLALTPVLITYISRELKPNIEYSYLKTWNFLWIVPFIYYIFFRVFSDPEYIRRIVIWPLHSIILPFIWFFGTAVSHYVILQLMLETAKMTSLQEQLKYTKLLSEAQRREYLSLQENIDQSRKLRHDMRHHFVALNGYLEMSDIPAAKKYLSSLTRALNTYHTVSYCKNHAVNSLLNYYAEKASENHIKVSMSVHLLESLSVSETDFCSILGNLFDNALEACGRQNTPSPFISLNMGFSGTQILVISIRNSYSGEIRMSEGEFLSSKRNERGIGTASIKYLVEKYDGICRFSYHNNVFEASVLLNPMEGQMIL